MFCWTFMFFIQNFYDKTCVNSWKRWWWLMNTNNSVLSSFLSTKYFEKFLIIVLLLINPRQLFKHYLIACKTINTLERETCRFRVKNLWKRERFSLFLSLSLSISLGKLAITKIFRIIFFSFRLVFSYERIGVFFQIVSWRIWVFQLCWMSNYLKVRSKLNFKCKIWTNKKSCKQEEKKI